MRRRPRSHYRRHSRRRSLCFTSLAWRRRASSVPSGSEARRGAASCAGHVSRSRAPALGPPHAGARARRAPSWRRGAFKAGRQGAMKGGGVGAGGRAAGGALGACRVVHTRAQGRTHTDARRRPPLPHSPQLWGRAVDGRRNRSW